MKVCRAAHFRDLFLNTGFMLETRLNHAAPSNVEEEQLCSESLPNLRGRIQTPGEDASVCSVFWHCQQLVATGEGKNADRSINRRLCFLAQQKKLRKLSMSDRKCDGQS